MVVREIMSGDLQPLRNECVDLPRLLQRQSNGLLFDVCRRLTGKTPGDGRTIHQTVKTLLLESPLVLVKLASGNAVAPAGFRYVPDSFGNL